MENYEKKYKEALKRAKKLYEQGTITESLGHIFPELKDEKIRKAILDYLTFMWGNSQDDVCGVNVLDAMDWVAKQDEQILDNSAKTCKDEQKTAWSEEDENVLEDIEEAIINYWHGDTQDILLDWLKSLKQRINV